MQPHSNVQSPDSFGFIRTSGNMLLWVAALATAAMTSPLALGNSGPDFNNDGYADLVIGTPFAATTSGIAQVASGSATGVWPSPVTTLNMDLEGVPGVGKNGDEFGMAMEWGDFNGDGVDDLAVGVPNRRIGNGILGPNTQAGCVIVFYADQDGLSDDNVQLWHQDRPGVPDNPDRDELFGWSLAAGDFDSDGFDDLAIGVPHERIGFMQHCGGVNLLYGSANGLTSVGAKFITQNSLTIPGDASDGDLFGYALASGDFNGDGDDDLAISAPDDDIGTAGIGTVTVLYGSLFGISGVGAQVFHSGVLPASVGPANEFGYSLAIGDFNDDGRDDLAVGCPFDDSLLGRVVMISGTALGLSAANAVAVFTDVHVDGDKHLFGWAVASGDFDNDGFADLAVGAPFEAIGDAVRAGRVHVLFGSEDGVDESSRQIWTQLDIDGSGGVTTDEWLGMTLATGDFDGNGADDLVMASPFEDVDGKRDSGAVIILPGSASGFVPAMSQFWTQPLLGRPAVKDEAMGFSLMR